MSSMHGKFVWYELVTTDAEAAKAFYGAVVGWALLETGQGDPPYTLLLAGDTPAAGLMAFPDAMREGARPGWLGYIAVDDVDVYVERVIAAGGISHRPAMDIPTVGRFAVVGDPQGVPFVLFKALPGGTPSPTGDVGCVGWRELATRDGAAAFDFYAGLFGWTKAEAFDMGPMGPYQLFATGNEAVGGIMTTPPAAPEPFWAYYIQVDSAAAAADRLQALGGRLIGGPHQVPGGNWVLRGIDPQGAMFALTSANA